MSLADLLFFLKALFAGFVVAMPVGAIGAMCMRHGLQGRWGVGMVTGIGAAAADGILAGAAMFGLSLVTGYLMDNQGPVRLIGGLFLLYLGIHMIRNRKPPKERPSDAAAMAALERLHTFSKALGTGFVLTIINPATLLGFAGVFAGLGLLAEQPFDEMTNFLIVGGAFLGSLLWWATLTGGSLAARERMSTRVIKIINTVLGAVVVVFGVAALVSFVQMLL
jgi:threonine/homoserine/homoserine lactone efflux protein